MRRTVPLVLFACFAVVPLQAQKRAAQQPPRRPDLGVGADTNDAMAYYSLGASSLARSRHQVAADAFYWATRLDPSLADAYYGRRVASLLADRRRLLSYVQRERKTIRSPEVMRIDSLQLRALTINPYLYRRYDRLLLTESLMARGEQIGIDAAEMNFYILRALNTADLETKGWLAYSDGRFPEALALYAQALKGSKRAYELHAARARIYFLVGNYDSALTEMTAALDEVRKKDDKELVFLYESKAVYEHSIATIHEHLDSLNAAREAYGHALGEDLSYFPAHVRLGALALQQGDTAAAVSELDLAVQLVGDEPALRYGYGYMLSLAKRGEEAEAQLRKAIELEPYYAASYHLLGRILDDRGDAAEAVTQYDAFLARASKRDPGVPWVTQRVAQLKTAAADGPEVKP